MTKSPFTLLCTPPPPLLSRSLSCYLFCCTLFSSLPSPVLFGSSHYQGVRMKGVCVCVVYMCVCKGGGNNRRPHAFVDLSAAGSPSHPVCSGFKPFLVLVTHLVFFLRCYTRISQGDNQIFAHCFAFIIGRL